MSFSSFKSFGHQVSIQQKFKSNLEFSNSSFESPIVDFKFYRDFTAQKKLDFIWSAGGNRYPSGIGPAISTFNNGFGFRPFSSN
jgi:hypothetical protein